MATLTAAASANSSPIADLVAPLIAALENLFGVNTRYAPADPVGGLMWGLFRGLNNALGFVPVAGTPTVGKPDPVTGTVTGTWSFTEPAGLAMDYVYNDASLGTVDVSYDGTFTYTPSQTARQHATTGTTDSFNIVATDAVAATVQTITVPVLPIASVDKPVPGIPTVGTPNATTGVVTGALNFTDPGGKPLTYTVTIQPTKGAVTVGATGGFTYTPTSTARQNATNTTTDAFTVTATNGLASAPETVTVPVLPLNVDTPGTITTIPSGVGVSSLAMSPDGKWVYVLGSDNGKGAVSIIDTATSKVITTIDIGADPEAPQDLAVSPSGRYLYATDSIYSTLNTPGGGVLRVIDTTTNTNAITTVPLYDPNNPSTDFAVAVSPDGSKVYAVDNRYWGNCTSSWCDSGVVRVMATANNGLTTAAFHGFSPSLLPNIVLSPNGAKLYVTGSLAVQASDGSTTASQVVGVIDTATTTLTTIKLGTDFPHQYGGMAVSPDGGTLYLVELDNPSNPSGQISATGSRVLVIDTGTGVITNTIAIGSTAAYRGLALSADGRTLYACSSWTNTVEVIDTATGKITNTIDNVYSAGKIVMSPDGSTAYVGEINGGRVFAISF